MAQVRGSFVELYDNVDKAVFVLLGDALKELPKIWSKVWQMALQSQCVRAQTNCRHSAPPWLK